ncbi:MAG TPA: DNA-processing protein DprA [Clostridia bacterium]|nr:DNA-processing protein DprA [Clostridia bacterium]
MAKYDLSKTALIALSMLELSTKKKEKIISAVEEPSVILSNPKVGKEVFLRVADSSVYIEFLDNVQKIDDIAFRLEKENVEVVTLFDENYPLQLRDVIEPPIVLYCKGNVSLLNKKSIAVVGTRRPTRYGQKIAEDFSREFVRAGLIIVSGFARGIDSVSHRVCVEENCPTIAVFGCGLNVCYPAENRELLSAILEHNGLIISEYALDVRPQAYHFPDRNRIISGLAEGVFLAEASEKSGSLITVNCAIEQGREIFVVPANINSPASAGSNQVLRTMQGAIVLSPEDVLSGLGIYNKKQTKEDTVQLSILEQQLVDALYEGDLHFEELLNISKCSASELSAMLMNLELCGVIEKLAGNYYMLCR